MNDAALPAASSPTQQSQPLALSSPSTSLLKRLADPNALPQAPPAKTVRMPSATSPAAAAAVPVSPLPQASPSTSLLLQSPLPREDDGGHAAVALASAFECLQDVDKVRDIAALADVLQGLGVKCAADLAHVDDASASRIKELLKLAAAHLFATSWISICHTRDVGRRLLCMQNIRENMSAEALRASIASGPADQCFAYLRDATKHVDPAAMTALLQQLGVSLPHELQHLDDAQLGSVVALLKPVAAKVFACMMAHVTLSHGVHMGL